MNKHYRKYLESKGVDTSKIKPKKKKSNKNKKMNKNTNKLNNNAKYVIYTETYYNHKENKEKYSWSYSIYDVEAKHRIYRSSFIDTNKSEIPYKLEGEINAVLNAIEYCKTNNYTDVCIYYHNICIENWANSKNIRNEYSAMYHNYIEKFSVSGLTFDKIQKHLSEKGRIKTKLKAEEVLNNFLNRHR